MNRNRNITKGSDEPKDVKDSRNASRNTSTRKGKKARKRPTKDYDAKRAADASTNDPAWYAQSPELLRDSSSIPFSWSTGTQISNNFNLLFKNQTMPGVCTIELKQVLGETDSRYDPVNVASDAIYSFVRHANSGHSNYDAPDLMMYLMGMSSIYSFITWCQRLLGLIMSYDQRNRYLPDALIYANGVDPTNLRNNIANFRFWLNTFISKASSFAIPNVMPYFSRMAYLYSNYYIDGPSIKDQFYMYVPSDITFLKFAISSSTTLGFLQEYTLPKSGTYATVAEIENFGDTIFSAMWRQEDFGIMSGDILKAYGDNIIKLAPMPELLVMQPVYDPMFLHQFKNAKVLAPSGVFVGDIQVSANGYITQQVRIAADLEDSLERAFVTRFGMEQILSTDFDAPTPEVVIESTRLMPTIIDDSATNYRALATGSEVPVCINVWLYDKDFQLQHIKNGGLIAPISTSLTVDMNRLRLFLKEADALSKFKYAPEVDYYAGEMSTTLGFLSNDNYMLWDVDNYAVLDSNDLQKMHQAAFMSMLAVPSIAKI